MIVEANFVCQDCGEIFQANPQENCYCRKCSEEKKQAIGHVLCDACRFVHEMSAARQEYYINGLDSDPEFYRFKEEK